MAYHRRMRIRRATPDDRGALCVTAMRAFVDDPVMRAAIDAQLDAVEQLQRGVHVRVFRGEPALQIGVDGGAVQGSLPW